MPIRMLYTDTLTHTTYLVDVYNFYTCPDSLETYVTCWMIKEHCWLTIPIAMLSPVETHESKKLLKEKLKNE